MCRRQNHRGQFHLESGTEKHSNPKCFYIYKIQNQGSIITMLLQIQDIRYTYVYLPSRQKSTSIFFSQLKERTNHQNKKNPSRLSSQTITCKSSTCQISTDKGDKNRIFRIRKAEQRDRTPINGNQRSNRRAEREGKGT